MRCYKVVAIDKTGVRATRFAGTAADSREIRETLVTVTGLMKKNITIDPAEIPVAKPDLLEFINKIMTKLDA